MSFPHSPFCGKVCGILHFHKIRAVSNFFKNSTNFFHNLEFSTKLFIWFAEFSKPRENGNFVEFRPQIVEITPEIGRLRTDLASGHLRKNSISLKFLAHACACTNANFCTRTLSNFFPQSSLWNSQKPPTKKVPKQLFHKLLCGIFKTSLLMP